MVAEQELAAVTLQKDTVLTIGVFDGVHLGHKHLFSRVRELAAAESALSGVVTFRRHPVETVTPDGTLSYLTSLEDKIRLIKAEGIDIVVALTFDRELSQLSARQFVDLLIKHLRMRGLVIGPDFALGRGREGTAEILSKMGEELGFSVTVVPPLRVAGEVVSSTAVRDALANGDVSRVVSLTGRPYSIKGRVVGGTGLGRKLGFPTANLNIDAGWAIPADGVYATITHINGSVLQSMTSIGQRPTFDGKHRTVETYILDFKGDLYGRDVVIDVVERLREQKKFPDAEQLKQQIADDIEKGRGILDSRAGQTAGPQLRHDLASG